MEPALLLHGRESENPHNALNDPVHVSTACRNGRLVKGQGEASVVGVNDKWHLVKWVLVVSTS